LAYACRCSRVQVRAAASHFGSEGAIYPGTCRGLGLQAEAGFAVRLDTRRVQGLSPVRFVDGEHGVVEHDVATDLGDFVLWRVEDFAAYHLAVVVDDAWQGVTDVVRGSDLLDSTPRQILLQQALGLPTPRYAHVPLALADNGQKLSKQNLAPALPVVSPALDMWNALVFLGYSPPLALRGAAPGELLAWAISVPRCQVNGASSLRQVDQQ